MFSNSFARAVAVSRVRQQSALSSLNWSATASSVPSSITYGCLHPRRTKSVVASNSQTANTCDEGIEFRSRTKRFTRSSEEDAAKLLTPRLSMWELLRSWAVLKLCSSERLTANAEKLLHTGRRAVGDGIFRAVVQPTFYDQFVGGESAQQLESTVVKLNDANIRLMLAVMLESDVDDSDSAVKIEDILDTNKRTYLDIIPKIAVMGQKQRPMCQLKGSGLVQSDILAKVSSGIGSNEAAADLVDEICSLMLEGRGAQGTICSLLKPHEVELFATGLVRMKEIVDCCATNDVTCVMDAEGTWLNPALSAICLAFMKLLNQNRPVVYHTYQCYLKSGLPSLQQHSAWARDTGLHFGAKIVRGAYLEKEKSMAAARGAECPLAESYEETNGNYDTAIAEIIERIGLGNEKLALVVATHNETSITKAVEAVRRIRSSSASNPGAISTSQDGRKGMKGSAVGVDEALFDQESVVFAQLYGMGNYATNLLRSEGLTVYKSVPYGNLFEVLPYLARRAQENSFVLRGARADGERQYLWREFRSRFGLRRRNQ